MDHQELPTIVIKPDSAGADSIAIPGYILEKRIGSGAMGRVYQATHKLLDCKVAVKLMSKELATDREYRTRFLNEARNIAKLMHPNIIHIHEINVHDSNYYIAMEFAAGGTLRERIQRGIAPDQALKILREIASALDCAHGKGIIHRDIKPANILFRADSTAVLADFGIAKHMDSDPNLTRAHGTLGTPAYMSPEQVVGKVLDARSDLYSLGVVFFEMLTSQKPYRAPDADDVIMMHLSDPVPRLPIALKQFRPIINRLMAKNPAQRFQTGAELIGAIDALPRKNPKSKFFVLGFSLLALAALAAAYLIPELRCIWQPIKVEADYFFRAAGSDKLQVLDNDGAMQSGDNYKIRFTAREASYVYIFQIDSSQQIYRLFPLGAMDMELNPVEAGRSYEVPAEDKSFELDDQIGREHIHFVAFRERNRGLEELYGAMSKAREQQDTVHLPGLRMRLFEMLEKSDCDTVEVLTFQHD